MAGGPFPRCLPLSIRVLYVGGYTTTVIRIIYNNKLNGAMPDLLEKHFEGKQDIPSGKVKELLTKSDSATVNETLTKLGWEGQLIATVTLRLSVDGNRTEDGHFNLRGALGKETVKVQAAKLWEKANESVMLEVELPPGELFKFEGGRLYSEYLDQESVRYRLTKDGQILTGADKKEHGIGDFCLRAITHLGKTSNNAQGPNIKITVLVHHLGADAITDLSEATQSPSWPGIKLLEGQCPLFQAAAAGSWGAPILPLLNIENRAVNSDNVPSGDQLRFAIASIMRTAARPTGCISQGGLKKYVDRMRKDVEAAAPVEPTITWPVATQPGEERGKSLESLLLNHSFQEKTDRRARILNNFFPQEQ